jgi:hypothetical protein
VLLVVKKNGTLGHCVLNDLLEEFGDDEDVRDATSVLYGGEYTENYAHPSQVLIFAVSVAADTVSPPSWSLVVSMNFYWNSAMKTTGAIIRFLLSLFLFPEVSQRVYEEIQSVTHGLRLPKISDRANLPYAEAVFKESARHRTFLPLGSSSL